MAWRIDESVVRGEIDNRERGRVTGRIWFVDRESSVELDLAGNAWRDLAGRRLTFVNPAPKPGELTGLARRQTGVIGDCTASRKVKVPEVSMEEFEQLYRERKPFPWHWGNSLYLEWFSTANGRVVIESTSFELTIDADMAWEMTAEEEAAQARANAEAMGDFMCRLGKAMTAKCEPAKAETEPEEISAVELEAEKMQADSDRLADRVQARLEREGDDADYERIFEEELERRRIERGEPPPTPEDEARQAEWIEELNQAAEEALQNPDPDLEAELAWKHPVAEQASELAFLLRRDPKTRGWAPADAGEEHPLVDLSFATMKAAAKLAGALNGRKWPPSLLLSGDPLVRIKRARGYLDDALLALDYCVQQGLAEPSWCQERQRDLNSLGHECDLLLGELRSRLKRGFD